MRKFPNEAATLLDDMLEGIVAAHPGQLTFVNDDHHNDIGHLQHSSKNSRRTNHGLPA